MGISSVTHRDRALHIVPSAPYDEEWVYQIAIPFQLSPAEIGLVLNVRRGSIRTVDLEVGNDLLITDRLDPISTDRIVPLNRGEPGTHPRTGRPAFFARYPLIGGFVPLGAMRPDGSPHPHAGTGFAVSTVIGFPADRVVGADWELPEKERYHAAELQQHHYDGTTFRVVESRIVPLDRWLKGWHRPAPGLCSAIPDGDDLLAGFSAGRGDAAACGGVLRLQRIEGSWRPASFTPVTPADGSSEATLVRDADGSLLFTARGGAPDDHDSIRLWRSSGPGRDWERLLRVALIRSESPISLNRAADGSLYFAGNPARDKDSLGRHLPSIEMRETLLLWPLSPDRRRLLDPLMARDCLAEFGRAPNGSIWRADHPVGLTVGLADNQWRHVLCYRVLDRNECVSDAPVTLRTGTHIEEVMTDGESLPLWRF